MGIAQSVHVYAALRNSESHLLAFKTGGIFGNQTVCTRTYRIRIDCKSIVERIGCFDYCNFTLTVYRKIIYAASLVDLCRVAVNFYHVRAHVKHAHKLCIRVFRARRGRAEISNIFKSYSVRRHNISRIVIIQRIFELRRVLCRTDVEMTAKLKFRICPVRRSDGVRPYVVGRSNRKLNCAFAKRINRIVKSRVIIMVIYSSNQIILSGRKRGKFFRHVYRQQEMSAFLRISVLRQEIPVGISIELEVKIIVEIYQVVDIVARCAVFERIYTEIKSSGARLALSRRGVISRHRMYLNRTAQTPIVILILIPTPRSDTRRFIPSVDSFGDRNSQRLFIFFPISVLIGKTARVQRIDPRFRSAELGNIRDVFSIVVFAASHGHQHKLKIFFHVAEFSFPNYVVQRDIAVPRPICHIKRHGRRIVGGNYAVRYFKRLFIARHACAVSPTVKLEIPIGYRQYGFLYAVVYVVLSRRIRYRIV